jgi:hypothetical protein
LSKLKLSALVYVCLFIVGCATPYSENLEGKPTARIRFLVTYPDHTWVSLLKRDCYDSTAGTETLAALMRATLRAPDRSSIGMPIDAIASDARFRERILPAGVSLYIAFFGDNLGAIAPGVSMVRRCVVAAKFVADAGADYEFRFRLEGQQCVASIDRLKTERGNVLTREPVQQVQFLPKCGA